MGGFKGGEHDPPVLYSLKDSRNSVQVELHQKHHMGNENMEKVSTDNRNQPEGIKGVKLLNMEIF